MRFSMMPSTFGAGAMVIGFLWNAEFAFAISMAFRVTRSTSSGVTIGLPANPQVPCKQ